ncbi:MAG: Spy/CpxP family protein refolding chaperone [Legionellaceae bacterium]|nr:Spy/CpxP family protein refolding chaperone [Legionellaceae bacterium]
MKKNLMGGLSAAVLSLAMFQAAPVFAMHEKCSMKEPCMMKKIEMMKDSLGLTPDQKQKLKAIKEKNKMFMEKAHKEKHMIHAEAKHIADAPSIDKMKLDKVAEKACHLEREMVKHRVMTKHEINQILTTKQKDQLKKDMRMMKQNMMKKGMMKKDMMQNDMSH